MISTLVLLPMVLEFNRQSQTRSCRMQLSQFSIRPFAEVNSAAIIRVTVNKIVTSDELALLLSSIVAGSHDIFCDFC
jgi:hypothetical protein